jgi:hypothetical protein
MFDKSPPIAPAVRHRILKRAANAGNAREVASVVLNSLIDERVDAAGCSLEEVKQLMVDALRASKSSRPLPDQRLVG